MRRKIRTQFTAYDREHFPECDNTIFLDYEKVSTGLSAEICAYGVQEKKIEGGYRWVPKDEWDE